MCVKLFFRDLNYDIYPLHPINTYTCGVITAPKVHDDKFLNFYSSMHGLDPCLPPF